MRQSLEKIGRFDPERARKRLRDSFYPEHTCFILYDDEKIGFYTFRLLGAGFQLDHLYVLPTHQARGVGSKVMLQLISVAEAHQKPIRLGALRESPANKFYQRHGFLVEKEEQWDIYYVRPCLLR
jgi:GNAT superfamily N-acetyltransferase